MLARKALLKVLRKNKHDDLYIYQMKSMTSPPRFLLNLQNFSTNCFKHLWTVAFVEIVKIFTSPKGGFFRQALGLLLEVGLHYLGFI